MQDAPDASNTTIQANVDKERSELTPLYSNANDNGTLRLIVAFFLGFTITLTVALGVGIYYGKSQVVPHGGVTSDDETCSYIGASIMRQGGNAVDAAIAVSFCIGVVTPHLTGLASGGFMLIYDHKDRKVIDSIDFRATRSNDGGIGVPGFVAGLYMAHELHGKLPWKTLVMPAYRMAKNGFKVSASLIQSEQHLHEHSNHNENLRQWLTPLTVGEIIINMDLASTLLSIAESGPAEFYNKTLVNDLKLVEMNSADIINYKPVRGTWLKESYEHYDIIVPGQGSGGPFLLNNLKLLNDSLSPLVSAVEAYTNAAVNWDPPFASNINTVDVNDLYVSVVSGLGSLFGSQILTDSGFILNNILELTNDTDIRPTMLTTPIIVIENENVCGRRLVFGGADVRDVAQALVYLLRNPTANITQSISEPRVRILYPRIFVERPNRISNDDFITFQQQYEIHEAPRPYPSINVIQKIKDDITVVADWRGFGSGVVF
ncbi:glutathione hydrolase 7-like [Planococcus citri]|uniref:glutathione hydrolase 7-like n=1 Tax=Planococcus citri TaxID=170843 RepID=UPI0031F9BD3C